MGLNTLYLQGKEYETKKILKDLAGQSRVELLADGEGKLILHKVIYRIGLPLAKIQSLHLAHVPEIYKLEEINDDVACREETHVYEEYIEGQTLDAYQKVCGGLTEEGIKDLLLQACAILEQLHANGLLHRDIKPGNILIDNIGELWLIDFDAARIYSTKEEQRALRDTVPLGTPGFAPPEQYGFGVTTPASDIFSLGKTMETLLSADYQGYLWTILEQCQKKDPEERFPDVRTLKEMLLTKEEEFRRLYLGALNGDSKAQYDLGCYFWQKLRNEEALYWLKKAAAETMLASICRADAEFMLGSLYQYRLQPLDLSKAKEHYNKAVALGSNEAYLALQKMKGAESGFAVRTCLWMKIFGSPLKIVAAMLTCIVILATGYVLTEEYWPVSEENIRRAEDLFNKGTLQANNGNYKEAIHFYTKALSHNRRFVNAYLYRALILSKLFNSGKDELEKSIADCEKCEKYADENWEKYNLASLYYVWGLNYYRLSKFEDCIEKISKAGEILRNVHFLGMVYAVRGSCYFNLKEYDKSLSDLNSAIAIWEKNGIEPPCDKVSVVIAYGQRADLTGGYLKDYASALKDYNRALEVSPMVDVLYCHRGLFYFKCLKDKVKAREDYEKALEINPNNSAAQGLLRELEY